VPSKWEKLAGETGEKIPKSRWGRLARLGGLGLSVGASAVVGKVSGRILPGSKDKKSAAASRRIQKNAQRVVHVLGRMKGASMKVGQILSADPDLVPPEFADVLSSLQAEAPPMTYLTVKEQIETAFDRPLDTVFRTFDPEPIGAASLGQVHRAVLTTGEDVAVKIQYPGIEKSIESDLKNLGSLLTLGRALVNKERLAEYLEECRTAALEEIDYINEAENLRHMRELFEGRKGVRIPRAYPEWTRKEVLMMEFIAGEKLDQALGKMADGPRRQSLLDRFVETYTWMFHELFEVQADPHPGNFLLDADDNLVLLDFGLVKKFDPAFADGILEMLVAYWEDDDQAAADVYVKLGFGRDGADPSIFDPVLIRAYHELIAAPFAEDAPFHYGGWNLRPQLQKFLLQNPKILKLAPPAESLQYFRVLSGVKGLFMKLDASVNMYRIARATAERRKLI
jgi:predicted unusual protein kinase regulating ubiquinone biosynthesis (AarF/ABC1/UbiB family)